MTTFFLKRLLLLHYTQYSLVLQMTNFSISNYVSESVPYCFRGTHSLQSTFSQVHVKGCVTADTSIPLSPLLPTAPPSLIDLGVVGRAEGDVASVDLSNSTQPEAFPLPAGEQVTWTMGGSVVTSDGRVTYGYPAVMFDAVERDDAGDYTLTASNTRSDGSEIGRAIGSFTLDVYCEPW